MSKSSHSRTRLVTPTVEPVASDRLPVAFVLRDLAVAPENLRFDETPDDGIGELAETIFAADLMQPLTVRPGRGQERPAMVLDGRRRLLALQRLLDAGRIAHDHPVSCFVETDIARQAAAVVLTNTGVPVHVADVIVAIGKMLKAKLTAQAIAGALGYDEVDVRRLAALSALHPKALEALKAGRCSLRQAKLLARLSDRQVQGEIAEAAMNGFGFQEWRVNERLDQGQVTIHDRRFAFVGRERYAAAGGRIESDLFGERADVVLDPDRLQATWTARAEAIAQVLAADRDWQVVVAVDEPEVDDEIHEAFGYAYGEDLDEAAHAEWREATAASETAQAALVGQDLSDDATTAAIGAFLAARLTADVAGEPMREISLICVFADSDTGLEVRAWGPPACVIAPEADEDSDEPLGDRQEGDTPHLPPRAVAPDPTPLAVAPAVEVEGVNHGLHELRTDVATRALVRALADDPLAGLVVVVARLFSAMVLHQGGGASSLEAQAYSRIRTLPIPALDGDVRRRLAERREAWAGSGQSPIAWVAALDDADRLSLLAELAGLSLNLREERTSAVRRSARAEAVEIAALCDADITRHWTPDAAFLSAHPKSKLLGMLTQMGAVEPLAGGARKDELVALVADRAAERRWAPGYLSWKGAAPEADDGDEPPPDAPEAPPTLGSADDEAPTASTVETDTPPLAA